MSDKELLELAAKAAGIPLRHDSATGLHFTDCASHASGLVTGRAWNPLADDGDALRLAGALNLNMGWSHVMTEAFAERYDYEWDRIDAQSTSRVKADDHMQAMRRAIVTVAAEIGKRL